MFITLIGLFKMKFSKTCSSDIRVCFFFQKTCLKSKASNILKEQTKFEMLTRIYVFLNKRKDILFLEKSVEIFQRYFRALLT